MGSYFMALSQAFLFLCYHLWAKPLHLPQVCLSNSYSWVGKTLPALNRATCRLWPLRDCFQCALLFSTHISKVRRRVLNIGSINFTFRCSAFQSAYSEKHKRYPYICMYTRYPESYCSAFKNTIRRSRCWDSEASPNGSKWLVSNLPYRGYHEMGWKSVPGTSCWYSHFVFICRD